MGISDEYPPGLARRLVLGLLGAAGLPASLMAAPEDSRYRELKEGVTVPLDRVTKLWEPFAFRALTSKLLPDGRVGSALLLPGVLLRVNAESDDDSGLRAFCLSCPHELCDVSLTEDAGLVRVPEAARKPAHPLFVCPCHFSVFDPAANGARLTGPAQRALYRFRLRVSAAEVEIDAVEEDALR